MHRKQTDARIIPSIGRCAMTSQKLLHRSTQIMSLYTIRKLLKSLIKCYWQAMLCTLTY